MWSLVVPSGRQSVWSWAVAAAVHASVLAALVAASRLALVPPVEPPAWMPIQIVLPLEPPPEPPTPVRIPRGGGGGVAGPGIERPRLPLPAPATHQPTLEGMPDLGAPEPGSELWGIGLPGDLGGVPGWGNGPGSGPGGPGGQGDGPIDLQAFAGPIVRPVLLAKVAPQYPPAARAARQSGRVLVAAVIGVDGRVEEARVASSTSPLFEAAALEAVRSWRYRPARIADRAVRVRLLVTVEFELH